jgi:hypothetical protein
MKTYSIVLSVLLLVFFVYSQTTAKRLYASIADLQMQVLALRGNAKQVTFASQVKVPQADAIDAQAIDAPFPFLTSDTRSAVIRAPSSSPQVLPPMHTIREKQRADVEFIPTTINDNSY